MAAEQPPAYLANSGATNTAEQDRRVTRAASGQAAGVVGSGDLAVTANGTPNATVNIAAGEVLIPGTQTSSQGTYYGFNDATVNLDILTGHPADPTNPRIDLVVAQVEDQPYGGTTNNDWKLAQVVGTPAPSPAVPAAPANSIVLAQIAVAANATSIVSGNITDLRPRASMPGQILQDASFTTSSSPLGTSQGAATTLATVTIVMGPVPRRLKLKGYVFLNSTVSGDTIYAGIFEGSTQLQSDQVVWDGNTNASKAAKPEIVLAPSAGVHTYTLKAWRHSGTGTAATVADATDPGYLYAEDSGPF